MKLGILSDTHNNQDNLKRALELFRVEDVNTLIHCGDMTTPETATLMGGFRVIHVTGNMDGSSSALRRTLLALNPDSSSAPGFSGQLDSIWVAASHGHMPERLDVYLRDGRYAYLFHGHTHRRRDDQIGQTRVINPGALGGLRPESRSICIVELADGDVRFVEVSER